MFEIEKFSLFKSYPIYVGFEIRLIIETKKRLENPTTQSCIHYKNKKKHIYKIRYTDI